jgi:prepilin-type N-terminal cleavage/methylation domain-containing protein
LVPPKLNWVKIDKEEVKKMRKGFTLIEVLVVAVIVAILAAVAIPAYSGYIQSSKTRVAQNVAGTIASALAAYYSEFPEFALPADAPAGGLVQIGSGSGNSVRLPVDYTCSVDASNVYIEMPSDTSISVTMRWKEGS